MANTILLPVDLNSSDGDLGSLRAALPLLEAGAVLHVLAVLPDFGLPSVSIQFDRDFVQKLHREAHEQMAKWIAANIPEGITVEPHIQVGTVYDQILRTADRLGVDLIVVGAHRPELSDYLIGSNAARVVRHAKQSVYVVRRPYRRAGN